MPRGDRESLKADIEDGYTKLSNLLLEALAMANLSGVQKGICFYLIRRTYSWGKKSEKISLKEFAEGCSSEKVYISKQLRDLINKRVINLININLGKSSEYAINTKLYEWDESCLKRQALSKQTTVVQKDKGCLNEQHGVVQIDNRELSKKTIVTPLEAMNNETFQTCKETIKEKEINNIVPSGQARRDDIKTIFDFYCNTLGVSRKLTPKRKAKIKARLKDFSVEQLKQAITNLHADDFIMGRGNGGKFYAELEYVFRSTEKTETWINKNPVKATVVDVKTKISQDINTKYGAISDMDRWIAHEH